MMQAAEMDENAWKPLLSAALAILDDLRARGFGAPDLVLGGGTVLMMRLHHRLSKDVDLFLHDAYRVSAEAARRAVAATAPRRPEQIRRLQALANGPAQADFSDIAVIGAFADLLSTLFNALAILREAP